MNYLALLKAFLICLLVSPAIADVAVSDDYKALIDARIQAQERWMRESALAQEEKVRVALQAAEKATDKAERAANERFASVNEFRAQLKDQTGTFITRNEVLAYLVAMIGFVSWLQRKHDK